jgi:uncharacterized peroxidase-related enzyme
MARISLVSDTDAADDAILTTLFEGSRALVGRVPNSLRTYAHLPLIAAFQAAFTCSLQREGAGGRLDARTKELVVLKTSMVNACEYCVTHNSALGDEAGVSAEQIEAMRHDYLASSVLDARDKAVIRWAELVTTNEAQRDREAFDELARWFDEVEILEITWLSAMFNMLNRVHDSLVIDVETQSEVDLIRKSKFVPIDRIFAFLDDFSAVVRAETARAHPEASVSQT